VSIDVPFTVAPPGQVELASIGHSAYFELPAGSYLVRCEQFEGADEDSGTANLIFSTGDTPRFGVPIADSALKVPTLLMTLAEPA
jgi:hypothetical protein